MLQRFIRCAGLLATLIFMLGGGLCTSRYAAAGEAKAMPRPTASPASQVQSGSIFALEHPYSGTDGALKEFGAARSDHAAIALDIGQCYHDKFGDPLRWSPTVRAILLFELDENLMHKLPYTSEPGSGESSKPSLPILNSFHAAAISFSDRISRNRLEFRRELENSVLNAFWYQVWIVGLGAGTTFLIGLRAIMKETTSNSSLVGVAAILLSAASVAVSSMNTFQGSQAIVLRDQRTLSQLQQLHWRVASDVLRRHDLCESPKRSPDDAMEVVEAWRSRLETILDSAVDSISKPGDLTSGSPAGPAASDKSSRVSIAAARR